MDIPMLRVFFMWCTIINAGFLILMSLILASAGDWIYRLHAKLFPLPRETFNAIIYAFLGLYKLGLIIFNLVPYLALLIMQ